MHILKDQRHEEKCVAYKSKLQISGRPWPFNLLNVSGLKLSMVSPSSSFTSPDQSMTMLASTKFYIELFSVVQCFVLCLALCLVLYVCWSVMMYIEQTVTSQYTSLLSFPLWWMFEDRNFSLETRSVIWPHIHLLSPIWIY